MKYQLYNIRYRFFTSTRKFEVTKIAQVGIEVEAKVKSQFWSQNRQISKRMYNLDLHLKSFMSKSKSKLREKSILDSQSANFETNVQP